MKRTLATVALTGLALLVPAGAAQAHTDRSGNTHWHGNTRYYTDHFATEGFCRVPMSSFSAIKSIEVYTRYDRTGKGTVLRDKGYVWYQNRLNGREVQLRNRDVNRMKPGELCRILIPKLRLWQTAYL